MRFTHDFSLWPRSGSLSPPIATDWYQHVQAVPATVWNIPHSMGDFVYFQVFDAANLWVQPSSSVTIDANNVQLTFSVAIAGSCYCMIDSVNTFSVAANTNWVIDHNTGMVRAACVWVGDTTYSVPSTESNNTLNQLELIFPSAVAGTVVLVPANASAVMDATVPYDFAHGSNREVVAWVLDAGNDRYYPSSFEKTTLNQVSAGFPGSQAGNRILISHGS